MWSYAQTKPIPPERVVVVVVGAERKDIAKRFIRRLARFVKRQAAPRVLRTGSSRIRAAM
jgi:hypothetical protein